jgi:hypothetical protein
MCTRASRYPTCDAPGRCARDEDLATISLTYGLLAFEEAQALTHGLDSSRRDEHRTEPATKSRWKTDKSSEERDVHVPDESKPRPIQCYRSAWKRVAIDDSWRNKQWRIAVTRTRGSVNRKTSREESICVEAIESYSTTYHTLKRRN